MNDKAELSITMIVLIVIAILVLVIVVFVFGDRGSEFDRATECVAAGGRCVPADNCPGWDTVAPSDRCPGQDVCCRATSVRS